MWLEAAGSAQTVREVPHEQYLRFPAYLQQRPRAEAVTAVALSATSPGGCGVSICYCDPLHLPRREPSEEGERVAHPLDVGDQCEPLQVADAMEPKLHVLPERPAR